MNVVAFESKRVFHSFVRVTRRALASLGLTAARFDMMSALLAGIHCRPFRIEVRQSELRQKLGVSAPVVSRMVRALEALGWVRRERDSSDLRQWLVELTEAGEARIRAARRLLLRPVERIVYESICPWRLRRNPDARFEHMMGVLGYLGGLSHDMGDRATLYYAWGHPDD